jgi:hypothetical protein
MEPLWSPVVATGGNRSQMISVDKPRKQAKTVAVGCNQLPKAAHGKEGVSGSSPEEGSARVPQKQDLFVQKGCSSVNVLQVWSLYGAFRSETGAESLRKLLGIESRLTSMRETSGSARRAS